MMGGWSGECSSDDEAEEDSPTGAVNLFGSAPSYA